MKIFRKIRQELLSNSHFKKYLAYAIGEIVLVVIGILIALWLNSLKASHYRDQLELGLYYDLKEELLTDLKEISSNRNYNAKYLARYQQASDIIQSDKNREWGDTLAVIATELTNFSDFKNGRSAYDQLALSGKLALISNKAILKSLHNLGFLYNYINRLEKNQEEFMYTLIPKITSYIDLNPIQVMQPDKLYSYQFRNSIEIMIKIGKEKDELYQRAETDLEALISLIDQAVA